MSLHMRLLLVLTLLLALQVQPLTVSVAQQPRQTHEQTDSADVATPRNSAVVSTAVESTAAADSIQAPAVSTDAVHDASTSHKRDVAESVRSDNAGATQKNKPGTIRTSRQGTPPQQPRPHHLWCRDWFHEFSAQSARSLRRGGDDDGDDLPPHHVECVLSPASRDVLSSDPWQLFQPAVSSTSSSSQLSDAVAVWQLGPRSPASQAPLQSSFHLYFQNLSSSSSTSSTNDRHDDAVVENWKEEFQGGQENRNGKVAQKEQHRGDTASSRDGETVKREKREGGVARELARRLRVYNQLYTTAKTAQPNARHATVGDRDITDADNGRFHVPEWATPAVYRVSAALLSIKHTVFAVLDRVGALQHVEHFAAETYANLRVRAWLRWSAWRSLFYYRHIVLRFPVGVWENSPATQDTPFYDRDSADQFSRMDMATRGTIRLLRIVSFPPVAQLQDNSLHYVCSLPAVGAASAVLQNDAAMERARQQQQRQQQQQKNGNPTAAMWHAGGRVVPSWEASASAPAESRGTIISYVLRLALQYVRHLFGTAVQQETAAGDYRYENGRAFGTPAAAAGLGARLPHVPSPAVFAARRYLRRVREELGPYQSSAVSALPVALQQFFGSRVLSSTTELVEEVVEMPNVFDDARKRERVGTAVRFTMQWSATLPASTPMCLALIALPPPPPAADTNSELSELPVHVEERFEFDYVWLTLVTAAFCVLQLQQRVAQSAVARHLVTGLTGMLLLGFLAVFYLLRQLQRMPVGKLALVVALALGGSTAALEGLWSVWWSYYNVGALWSAETRSTTSWNAAPTARHRQQQQPSTNAYGGYGDDGDAYYSTMDANSPAAADGDAAGLFSGPSGLLFALSLLLVFACVVSGMLLNWLIPVAYLRSATWWSVRVLLVLLWWATTRQNPEATVLAVVMYLLVLHPRLWNPFLLLRTSSRPCRDATTSSAASEAATSSEVQRPRDVSASSSLLASWDMEVPQTDLPQEAQRSRPYFVPLATGNRRYTELSSRSDRMRAYEEEGAECTRRALEQLAAHLRENPGKYATRLRDANSVQRWAGAADGGDDDTDSDEEH